MNTLLLLGVAHVIGDYLLQWRTLAKKKKESGRFLLCHAALYALAMLLVFLCAPPLQAGGALAALALTHWGIDFVRIQVDKKRQSARVRAISFCVDQALHLGVIVVCWAVLLRGQQTEGWKWLCGQDWFRPTLLYAALLCVIWKPAAILVSKVLDLLPSPAESKPGEAKTEEPEELKKTNNNEEDLEEDFRSGELIGKLERVIVAALVLSGAATAIGFVLTAKSVARFKQMEEDRDFAERYLVGTLLSVAIALTAALLVKGFL